MTSGAAEQARELRAEFDRSFARPRLFEAPDVAELLAVRVRGHPYAILVPAKRLRARPEGWRMEDELVRVVARQKVVRIPSTAPGLIGIAGIRGDIVPVFSLSTLLGHGDDPEPPAWTILARADQLIGLAFAELEAYLLLPSSAVRRDETHRGSSKYVRSLVGTGADLRPVIDLPLVLNDILKPHAPRPPESE